MADTTPATDTPFPERDIYSVSRLNREVRQVLERGFTRIWLEGELSNLARPSSGHLYFTLKDARAQIRAAMFRNRNQMLRFNPGEGMQVLVRARVSLYEPRGDYQLIVDHMEQAGEGDLQRAFEALKRQLDAEGLFAAEHKQDLPLLPARIGVLTSPSGAALRDVLSVLRRRFPAIPVLIYPVPVQGKTAAAEIAAMIDRASRRADCDVLILTRGGGSLEDLWPFNEARVAHAIYRCRIPLVSAVGHEIDYTIADFVADRRAPTPSAAAELVSPDQRDWLARLQQLLRRLEHRLQQAHAAGVERLGWLEKRLQQRHPGQQLRQQAQRLDNLERRYRLNVSFTINKLESIVENIYRHLRRVSPAARCKELDVRQQALTRRLQRAMQTLLAARRQALNVQCRALDTVSPLATLERGYAIVQRADGTIVRQPQDVTVGSRVTARLARGELLCSVDAVKESL